MGSNEDQQTLIRHRLEKAETTLADINFLLQNKKLTMAVNRIYYAAYYCMSALALTHNFSASKHSQLIGWFNKTFIKENVLKKEFGNFVTKAFENRSTGDYDDFAEFQPEDVQEQYSELKLFYQRVKELIYGAGR